MKVVCVIITVFFIFTACCAENKFYHNASVEATGMQAGKEEVNTGICSYSATCTVSGYEGACVSISAGCCSSGSVTSGLCPGSSDIKCCTQPSCTTPSGTGSCMQTSLCSSKGGSSFSGYCSGPSDLQCCVTGTVTTSSYGVDVSSTITTTAASCLKSAGFSFVIPRGYKSTGSVDTQVCTSIINAKSGGISVRDTYLFPCPTCSKSASTQLGELVSYLKANCASQWSGRIWLDIEGSQYWTGVASSNKVFYQALVDACSTYGVSCGIYSSTSQWSAIFGSSSYCYGNSKPLWYAHYDNLASFSDFSTFGCWTSPHAKQYAGDVTSCSMGVDKNYSPSF